VADYPVLAHIAFEQRAVGRVDVAALPVDGTLRPRPLGVVAERRDVPGPHGPVDLVDELLVNLVVGLQGEVAAVQDEDPRLRVEEESAILAAVDFLTMAAS
jgi:hypothetical protein